MLFSNVYHYSQSYRPRISLSTKLDIFPCRILHSSKKKKKQATVQYRSIAVLVHMLIDGPPGLYINVMLLRWHCTHLILFLWWHKIYFSFSYTLAWKKAKTKKLTIWRQKWFTTRYPDGNGISEDEGEQRLIYTIQAIGCHRLWN